MSSSTIAGAAAFTEPVMVRIPEGWFTMGCDTGRDDERPAHRVWVNAFDLAVCQVTRAEYAQFLAATHHPNPAQWDDPSFDNPHQPLVAPSWLDGVAYCEWLRRAANRHYRLPTEAEWERAARGGIEGYLYTWGDAQPQSLPGYADRWKTGPERVGTGEPNPYGLFNMGDNVHEWCADWYDAHYYQPAPERNPRGPSAGTRRSSRGGSWRHQIKVSRVAARSSIPPEFKYADYGFRIARDI